MNFSALYAKHAGRERALERLSVRDFAKEKYAEHASMVVNNYPANRAGNKSMLRNKMTGTIVVDNTSCMYECTLIARAATEIYTTNSP